MQVRHLATSYAGRIAAIGAFESKVVTWDLTAGAPLASFETVLDFGGDRLAVDTAGERCAVAGYASKLECYRAQVGTRAWFRFRSIKRIQFVGFSHSGQYLYCGGEKRACLVLDAQSGQEVDQLPGVRRVWESPFSHVMLIDAPRLTIKDQAHELQASIQRTTFAVLDAAFGPEALCLSESGGDVRCLDLSGQQIWRYSPVSGRHVLHLSYCQATGSFFGVEWPYEHGGPKVLLGFDSTTGEPRVIADLGKQAEIQFFNAGGRLLSSDGTVWDTSNGAQVGRLPFQDAS